MGRPCRSWVHDVDHLPPVHPRDRPARTAVRVRQPAYLRPPLALTAGDGRFRTPLAGGGGSRAGDGLPRLGIDLPRDPGDRPDAAAAADVVRPLPDRGRGTVRLRGARPRAADAT